MTGCKNRNKIELESMIDEFNYLKNNNLLEDKKLQNLKSNFENLSFSSDYKIQVSSLYYLSKIATIEQKIDEANQERENIDHAELQQRVNAKNELIAKIGKLNEDRGQIRGHLVGVEREITQCTEKKDKLARKYGRNKKLRLKSQLISGTSELLSGLLDTYQKEARHEIQVLINEVLESVLHRNNSCTINDDYSLDWKLEDRVIGKSGGENQLLGLTFMASLVKFSSDRIGKKNAILKPGTVAPMILDAPLGQLDEEFGEGAAGYISGMAPQVVFLLSSGHGRPRVLKALRDRVGKEYILISRSKGKKSENKKAVSRVIDGNEYDCTLFNQDINGTYIKQIA